MTFKPGPELAARVRSIQQFRRVRDQHTTLVKLTCPDPDCETNKSRVQANGARGGGHAHVPNGTEHVRCLYCRTPIPVKDQT